MPTGLNGFRPQTRTARSARESSRSRGPSPTLSEGSPKGDGRTPKAGPGSSLPTPATANTGQAKSRKVAKANKRFASRFYQLKKGHCLTGQYLAWTNRRLDATCWRCQYSIQTREHLFKTAPNGRANRRLSGRPSSRRSASSPYHHRGAARRRAVQPGGARFPCDNRRQSDGRPTGGKRGR